MTHQKYRRIKDINPQTFHLLKTYINKAVVYLLAVKIIALFHTAYIFLSNKMEANKQIYAIEIKKFLLYEYFFKINFHNINYKYFNEKFVIKK